MLRIVLTLAVLMMAGTVLTGCRAEVEPTQTGVGISR